LMFWPFGKKEEKVGRFFRYERLYHIYSGKPTWWIRITLANLRTHRELVAFVKMQLKKRGRKEK